MGKFCEGGDIGSYTTLQAAKEACSNNNECGCIWDEFCDGNIWLISKGYNVTSDAYGSCAWTKSKLMFPFNTRKQIYSCKNKTQLEYHNILLGIYCLFRLGLQAPIDSGEWRGNDIDKDENELET